MLARKDLPSLQIVQIPAELNVGADYGMIVLKDAPAPAAAISLSSVSDWGQAILMKHGFGRGDPAK